MKVVILAGGFGTRISEYTEKIPKPMIPIGGFPILWHIMNIYSNYGFNDFNIALGYKGEIIKEYFSKQKIYNSDFTIDLNSGGIEYHQSNPMNWKVTLVNTGLKSMTGGRLKRMQSYIGNERFLLTYGDGLSNINIESLINFHKSHGKMVTVTAVHPVARFGELNLEGDKVNWFKEKPQTVKGWINGGFFVIEPEFFNYIDSDQTILEKEPLEEIAKRGQLMAYKHDGFWQCMDTRRDKDFLEEMWNKSRPLWIS
tara:strand:- start:1654 stop:2418 length:765 start_codon:yes stop_codon:yes gene_type:complete